jgi:hypothetical protein
MESFFKTLKVERIRRLRYATRAEARLDIVDSRGRDVCSGMHGATL